MLSVTYTIPDTKLILGGDFSTYGYIDDEAFNIDLTRISEDTEFLRILPCIGEEEYERIKAKDKVDLNMAENFIYRAEIYAIALDFTKKRKTSDSAATSNASKEKLTIEGYTYEMENSSGSAQAAPLDIVIKEYNEKYNLYMLKIGCDNYQLSRGGSVFG